MKKKSHGSQKAIYYALGCCSFGHVLVASSKIGICAVTLGDDPDFLIQDLRNRFLGFEIIEADASYTKTVAAVVSFVNKPVEQFSVSPDLHGTVFQKQVWRALQKIPFGKTATYADIAKRIGKPTSARAVAQACGANNIAVIIPCHRVVRTDGSLSGYRWGVQRKAALLKREQGKS